MERSVFYDIINRPELAAKQESELAKVVDQYPWFSHAQVFYAKALSDNEDPRFEDQLIRASVYAVDREVLFELIHAPIPKGNSRKNRVPSEEKEFPRQELKIVEEVISPEKEVEPENLEKPLEITRPSLEDVIVEKAIDELEIVQEQKVEEEIELEEEKVVEEESIELLKSEEVLEKVREKDAEIIEKVESEIEKIEENKIEEEESEEETETEEGIVEEEVLVLEKEKIESKEERNPQLQKQILTGAVSRVIEQEVEDSHFELAGDIKLKEEQIVSKPQQQSESVAYTSYTQWLLERANTMKYEVELNSDSKTDVKEAVDESNFTLNLEEKQILDKKSKANLLDAFIAKDAKITQGKAKEYDVVDRSASSLEDRDEFLTETMAVIYAQQGKISKAKKAYKKLSLIYPEKSIYFAARIKELDKK